MGWNTVVVVMNDAVHMIEKDPEFGAALASAIRSLNAPVRRRDLDVPAKSADGGVFCNAATIISQEHADVIQIVEVGRNCGRRVAVSYSHFSTLLAEFAGDDLKRKRRAAAELKEMGRRLINDRASAQMETSNGR